MMGLLFKESSQYIFFTNLKNFLRSNAFYESVSGEWNLKGNIFKLLILKIQHKFKK